VSQTQNWPAPQPLREVLQDLSPELAYAERDRALKKILHAAQLHQADNHTMQYLSHFSKTLTKSLGKPAQEVLPIFQELWATKELRARYLERRRSLLEQKQAAEHSTLHLKVAIAALEDSATAEAQPPEQAPERLWRSLGVSESHSPPSVPPSYGGPTVVGGLSGLGERMRMRYQSQVFALEAEAFRAHALLKEIDADGPSRAVEAVVAAKEAELLKELCGVLDRCERSSLQLMYDQRAEADELEALA
jgi:hypothetical protein